MLAIAALDLLPLLERRDSGSFHQFHGHHVCFFVSGLDVWIYEHCEYRLEYPPFFCEFISKTSSFRTFIPLGMLAVAALDLLPLLERRDSGGFQEVTVHAHHVGV